MTHLGLPLDDFGKKQLEGSLAREDSLPAKKIKTQSDTPIYDVESILAVGDQYWKELDRQALRAAKKAASK